MARVRTLTLVGVAAAMAVLGAGTASATVFERGRISDPYAFSHDDCGFDVDVEGTSSGHFRVREGKGKTATAFFELVNFAFTETQTNPENGKFVTITANASFREIKARRVEGNVFEFWAVEAGQFRMYDSDGGLVKRDRGSCSSTSCSTPGATTSPAARSSRTSPRGARSAPGVRRLLRAHHAVDRLLSSGSRACEGHRRRQDAPAVRALSHVTDDARERRGVSSGDAPDLPRLLRPSRRRRPGAAAARPVPDDDFPVLSAGPTPHAPLERWSFTIEGEVDEPRAWTWDELARAARARRSPSTSTA